MMNIWPRKPTKTNLEMAFDALPKQLQQYVLGLQALRDYKNRDVHPDRYQAPNEETYGGCLLVAECSRELLDVYQNCRQNWDPEIITRAMNNVFKLDKEHAATVLATGQLIGVWGTYVNGTVIETMKEAHEKSMAVVKNREHARKASDA